MSETPEKTAVSKVLTFGNWPQIDSVEQVYKLFQPTTSLPFRLAVIRDRPDGTIDLQEVSGVRVATRDGEFFTSEREMALMRGWHKATKAMLGQLVRKRPAEARREFGQKFTQALKRGILIGQPHFDGKVLAQNSRCDGPVDTQVAFGLALLLDAEIGFIKKLRRCAWKNCRLFFLHDTKGDPKFCPDCRKPRSEHMRHDAAERQRRTRKHRSES